jgi:RES domain-containing protein
MYDAAKYQLDRETRTRNEAAFLDGAVLYRLTSPIHCDKTDVLSGKGANRTKGRYHNFQSTSYCASNVLLCMAEVLFHMYRAVIDGIRKELSHGHLMQLSESPRILIVFAVAERTDLIWADSEGCRTDYAPRVGGTSVVYPDATYEPMQAFAEKLRELQKPGVMYPSARHSQDFAVALFEDQNTLLKTDPFERLAVTLKLINEEQELGVAPETVSPLRDKLHPTMGFYEFADAGELERVRGAGLLNPSQIPQRGYVDFVRRKYRRYPDDACVWA